MGVTTGQVPEQGAALRAVRDDEGATTAEYAVCTGAGVGFAALLYQFLTSGAGEALLKFIFSAIRSLVGF